MKLFDNLKLSNDAKFKHLTALKVVSVPFVSLVVIAFGLWIFLETVYAFFISNISTNIGGMKEIFYSKLFYDLKNYAPFLVLYFIFLYSIGFYLASLLLRSFRKIGQFAKRLADDPSAEFKLSALEKRKYLMSFAKIFFEYMMECRGASAILKSEIPMKFWNIRGVVFDYIHYMVYVLLLFIITIVSTLGLDFMCKDISQNLTSFAIEVLTVKHNHLTFLATQQELLQSIVMVAMVMMVLVYFIMANNLFSRINGVTYAYFRTLKEIIQGKWEERINLRYGDPGSNDADRVNALIDGIDDEIDEVTILEEHVEADQMDNTLPVEEEEEPYQEQAPIINTEIVIELDTPPPVPPPPFEKKKD